VGRRFAPQGSSSTTIHKNVTGPRRVLVIVVLLDP
jgi:hypothetical protein